MKTIAEQVSLAVVLIFLCGCRALGFDQGPCVLCDAKVSKMKVKARFPIKIGDVLVAPGTEGETIAPTPRILEAFPGLAEKPDGKFLLVKFPGLDECLVMPKQVVKL